MKSGRTYWRSREQRVFDRTLAAVGRPALFAARIILGKVLPEGLDPIFLQERIGYGGQPFIIEKLQTLLPESGGPHHDIATLFRKLGLDELAQLKNVREGTMSISGYRPILAAERENVLEQLSPALGKTWNEFTIDRNPGIISSYGLYHHTHPLLDPNECDIRAEMDIFDARHASMLYDAGLVVSFIHTAVSRRLQ